jgi:hypothetical protein
MFGYEPNDAAAGFPLKAHVDELRSRCEAVARFQGGSTHYLEELSIFRNYAAEKGLILPQPPVELNRTPDDEGNEHQVWFLADSASFLKATWPGFFGLLVIHRPHEEPKASPIAYLERWLLHNELFGDDIRFLGAIEENGQLRLLIRQPAIAGEPATLEQIDIFFTGNGWLRFKVGGEIAFFDPERNVAISGTHRGNLILMDDGLLAPIDLRVQALSGSLLDTVVKLCQSA